MDAAEALEAEVDDDNDDDYGDDSVEMANMHVCRDESADTARRTFTLWLLLTSTVESEGSMCDCLPPTEERRAETEEDDEVKLRFLSFSDNYKT